ncbi:MAG: helix-turn-helix transcriptional regulator [Tannerellaceae bacterium]|jgi:transcriptional regulator with XRE-family HTH domain|nr:helix-turn-helix transcriptional regulator [Tannerellaceae bacterium]
MLRVQEVCKKKGITMQDLAKRMGITYQALYASASGNPTIGKLSEIATALGVEVVELFKTNGDNFTALIDQGGKLYRFDSIDALTSFIWDQTLK